MKNVFILNHCYYESSYDYHFEGPDNLSQEDFQKICNSFLEEAGYKAIIRQHSDREYGFNYIGWSEIVESLVLVLEKHGFRHFIPKKARYFGGDIIDRSDKISILGRAGGPILKFNEKVRDKMAAEMLPKP